MMSCVKLQLSFVSRWGWRCLPHFSLSNYQFCRGGPLPSSGHASSGGSSFLCDVPNCQSQTRLSCMHVNGKKSERRKAHICSALLRQFLTGRGWCSRRLGAGTAGWDQTVFPTYFAFRDLKWPEFVFALLQRFAGLLPYVFDRSRWWLYTFSFDGDRPCSSTARRQGWLEGGLKVKGLRHRLR